MKSLHRPDLYAWSAFDAERNVDFNSVLWVRPEGNVAIDPLPLTDHDRAHLSALGSLAWIVITNSDHVRASGALRDATGAKIAGPAAEREHFPIACDRWLSDGESLAPGLTALALEGSKTPGELALLLDETTLITGDLVRAHRAGALMRLPDGKLADAALAGRSIARLASLTKTETVLVGDGWSLFGGGAAALGALAAAG